jgi:acetolactate synthase-1/2/3 large subunit
LGKTHLLKHILVRHEQSAAHAADAYARATNKVGVCFATSGPSNKSRNRNCKCSYGFYSDDNITGQVGAFIGTDA